MDKTTQQEMLYLMERVTEPLYFGPRGKDNMYFNMPMDGLSEKDRTTSNMIRDEVKPGGTFTMTMPKEMPDLTTIAMLCPRDAIFSYFIPAHREAAAQLAALLKEQGSKKDFVSAAAIARDSPLINTQLWVHATIKASLERPDMKGVKFPALWEIMPDLFITPAVRMAAQKQAAMPTSQRSVVSMNNAAQISGAGSKNEVKVNATFSGRNENPENKLSYFREDLGVASHHWHWHIIYSGMNKKGLRDRRGELFYYMHHGMLARYDAERLCNGLSRTRILDITQGGTLEEGYFPKLTAENSGRIWGGRQANTVLSNVDRYDEGGGSTQVAIDDLRKWKDRILDAIDTGIVMTKDKDAKKLDRVTLTIENGTNLLGDMIENGGNSAPNEGFYGNLHNMGHVIIGYSHDPEKHHNENIGAMGSEATAMKDPSFYRWHKFIDQLFEKYKSTLEPYTVDELEFRGVRVDAVDVQTGQAGVPKNTLRTFWMESEVDLSRGLDIARRNKNAMGPVYARFTHLNHVPFEYTVNVNSRATDDVEATVRIFLAPHRNEQGEQFRFAQQRLLFFEMDKFSYRVRPGKNEIKRKSEDSTVTIPWEQSFRDLEALMDKSDTLTAPNAICGCGWPQHLLVPKGKEGPGYEFDMVVMLTDAKEDLKNIQIRRKESTCKESMSFCGVLDEKYPDAKPMGFPFDRKPRMIGEGMMAMEAMYLSDFIKDVSNMKAQRIRISFDGNSVANPVLRPGGATSNMDVLPAPLQARENPNRGGPVQFRQGRQESWGYPESDSDARRSGPWRDYRQNNDHDLSPDRY